MHFDFATAHRILFGAGSISELPKLAPSFGRRAFVVTGVNQDRAKKHLSALDCTYFSVQGEPTVALIREAAQAARAANFVIGFGGGSAIDAAKAIAAIAPNSGEPLDYLEVIGQARPLEHPPLPFIAVPTTAGTGAEVTRNAVLGSPEQNVKASIRSPQMLARLAIVDPDLTLDLPSNITAATGLDTLTQLIEPYVSSRGNALTDMYCLDALPRVIKALPLVFANGADEISRAEMSYASLLSGLALANSGLGAVHGFAAPLGGLLNAPHGALCAAVLPHATAVNIRALRQRLPQHPALPRYARISAMLNNDPQAPAEAAVSALSKLCLTFNIPTLRTFGLTQSQIPAVVEKAAAASSMKANPVTLTPPELTEILELSL